MHTGAGHLAGGPEPRQRGGAVEVGEDAADAVVSRRGDRQPVEGGVEAGGGQVGCDRREAGSERLEAGGVEPEVVDALGQHSGGHGPGHHIAGFQLVDEALAGGVAQ